MDYQSQLVGELKTKENCWIKIINSNILLNDQQLLPNQKNELIKILLCSQKNLARVITQQKDLIDKTLSFLQYKPVERVEESEEDEDFEGEGNDECSDERQNNSDNEMGGQDVEDLSEEDDDDYEEEAESMHSCDKEEESSSESENYIQNFEKSILEDMNKLSNEQDDNERRVYQTRLEKINEDYHKLIMKLLDNDDDKEGNEMIFVSPFSIQQIRNEAYFRGSATNLEAFSKSYCADCENLAHISLRLINDELKQQNLFLVFEQFNLNLQPSVECGCTTRNKITNQVSTLNIQHSNILYNNLEIYGQLKARNKVEIQIENILASLQIHQELVGNIFLKQSVGMYICLIKLFINRFCHIGNIFDHLKNVSFSEICFVTSTTPIVKNLKCILNNTSTLIRLKRDKSNQNKSTERFNLINERCSSILSLISAYKLLQDDFSFFRIMYDLHELD